MTEQAISDVLETGQMYTHDDAVYQVIDSPVGAVSSELGDRTLNDDQVPEVGDECLHPDCEGTVEDVNGRRWCSEGCFEWLRTTPADGDECDKYGNKCDGNLQVDEDAENGIEYECDTCGREGWSAEITWSEAWLPAHFREEDE